MNIKNNVQLIGRVGMNPEVKRLDSGNTVCNMSIAVTEKRKDSKGEWNDYTTWWNLIAWGNRAESIEKYVGKGDEILVQGKLDNTSWEDKSGNKRQRTEIVIENFKITKKYQVNTFKPETEQ